MHACYPLVSLVRWVGRVGSIVASFVGKLRLKRTKPRKGAGIVLLLGFGQGAGQHHANMLVPNDTPFRSLHVAGRQGCFRTKYLATPAAAALCTQILGTAQCYGSCRTGPNAHTALPWLPPEPLGEPRAR